MVPVGHCRFVVSQFSIINAPCRNSKILNSQRNASSRPTIGMQLLAAPRRHRQCFCFVRNSQGYVNHVVAVLAPKDQVSRRGRLREREEGKRYAPWEFDRSVAAICPIVRACNGRYEVLRVVEPPGLPPDAPRCLTREVVNVLGTLRTRLVM